MKFKNKYHIARTLKQIWQSSETDSKSQKNVVILYQAHYMYNPFYFQMHQ